MINNKNIAIIHAGKLFSGDIFWKLSDRIIYGTISTAEPTLISRSKRAVNHSHFTNEDGDLEHPMVVRC